MITADTESHVFGIGEKNLHILKRRPGNFELVGTEQGYIKRTPGVAGVETQKENLEMEAQVKVKMKV